jgi:hypothetical protein
MPNHPVDAAGEPPPVTKRLLLPLPPAAAFELFTAGMSRWWPFRGHSCTDDPHATLHIEPRLGGEVIERSSDGARHLWGTVTQWDPPHAFAMRWHPAQPLEHATELRCQFVAQAQGCELQLWHGGWSARGDNAAEVRDNYDHGWPVVLAAFERLARDHQAHPSKEETP